VNAQVAVVGGAASRPSARYDAGVREGRWQDDPAQRAVLPVLDRIHAEILDAEVDTLRERLAALIGRKRKVRGLYLHGGVGRGKTFLVDLLHDGLPERLRRREHFHRFMGRVHAELTAIGPVREPLAEVARRLADRPLLVLDEFFVGDIGDAMILGELLRHLRREGVCLVTTSNIPPAELYRDGLQRAKFLPAIARLERHCEVLALVSPTDWRLRALTMAPVYHVPDGADADAALAAAFARLAPGEARPEAALEVNGRRIALRRRADGIAWFDFAALCEGPRAVADYIEIARSHHTVLLSGVPRFDGGNDDPARRFVHLVDEFYDRSVNLLVSAAAEPAALYAGHRLLRDFERTASRLLEMRSAEYLARPHRP
jgi:cell division protein ZapE